MKGLKEIVNNLANRINQPHYLENELKKVFNTGVEWERNRDKWISVDEQLPPQSRETTNVSAIVWGYDSKWGVHKTYYNHRIGTWMTERNITHWMPIHTPEPPKREEK